MKFAAIQLCSQGRLSENLVEAGQIVAAAARRGVSAVLLPEGFAYLGSDEGKCEVAERLGGQGPIQEAISSWCKEHDLFVIAGGLAELSDSLKRPFNSSVVFDRQGQIREYYRKLHLFDARLPDGTRYLESKTTSVGSKVVVAEVDELAVGLSICYDLRFPELFACQRKMGAHVLTVPAAFTEATGEAHWRVLLRARAIENQCWVIAAAQGGEHPCGRRTYGHSMIVDPWGRVLDEAASIGAGFVSAEISLEAISRLRERMPMGF